MTIRVPEDRVTVQEAVNAAQPGDVIRLAAGFYDEDVTTKYAQSGVMLTGAGDDSVISRLTVNKPDWIVERVKFAGLGKVRAWWGYIDVSPGAHRLTVDDVTIDATGSLSVDGIAWSNNNVSAGYFPPELASDCTIKNCRIIGVKGRIGINVFGARNIIRNCVVRDGIACDFLRLFGEDHQVYDNVFENNLNPAEGETIHFHPDGFQTFGYYYGSRRMKIERNVFRNLLGQICQLEENLLGNTANIGDWLLANNVFQDTGLGASITLANMTWLNNTFVRCCINGGHVLNFGSGARGTSNGMKIFNNIFLDCGKMDSVEQGWYGDGGVEGMPVVFEADYNYYGKGPTFAGARTDSASAKFRWSEVHGVNGGDPMLTADFHLLPGSPLIGAGKDGVDIGAFQSGVEPPPPPPPPPPPVETRRVRVIVEKGAGTAWTSESETIIPIE